ncbi:MAG TPA: ATP-binding protein [Candidatus Binataceae bacterium]|nr:ATP-binding protein [Candidatus Binataceae bacterium]
MPISAALILVAAYGVILPALAVAAILASFAIAFAVAVTVTRGWASRAERLEGIAVALAQHRAPSHVIGGERDPMSQAERRLLEAADALVVQFDALEEQREEFEAILRGMTEAVVVTGARGEVVLMNGAARQLFGLATGADNTGRHFVELCRDPRLQEFVARATVARGGVLNGEFLIQTPAARHLEVSAAPVGHGGAAARVLVVHDITRLKLYETARTDFIANLTHELRTPLSALCGYAETLAQGVDDRETERRFLGIIDRQAQRLARLIDDLISLSDLERGLTPLKLESIEPGELAAEILDLVRDRARRAEIALELRCAEGLPALQADHDRMQQVLLNLLDNALKYTPRGGRVTTEVLAVPGGANGKDRAGVSFKVIDTGEGVPAADISRLTERFYRVDRARSRELGGTGLGLAIVKHILQMHHGTLTIESRLREGTTVTVWLPTPAL